MPMNNDDVLEDAKDYTKQIWIGILVVFGLMIAVIAIQGGRVPTNSEVTTKHILITFSKTDPAERSRAMTRIQEIRQRINDGESFAALAEQYSQDPGSAARGGYLSAQPRGTFEENYENYAWTAPLNELSEVIQSAYGFHLIVVTDRFNSGADQYERDLDKLVSEERARDRKKNKEAAEK